MTEPVPGAEAPPSSAPDRSPEPIVAWVAPEQHAALIAERQARRGRHRRRRRSPTSHRIGAAVIAAAGLAGAATTGSATGDDDLDRLWRGGIAAAVAAAAATAPTWALVVLATGAAALGYSGGGVATTAGVASLVLALVLAWRQDLDRHLLKSAAGALAVTALLRAPGGVLGVTAAATAVLAALVIVTGLRGRRRWRRRAILVAAGLVGLGAVATILGAVAGLGARGAFERSSTDVGIALSAASSGDNAQAAESAHSAAADLQQARSSVRIWWARPAWAVPVVGAHLRAADRVASSAGPVLQAAAGSAGAVNLDALRSGANGGLDLDRLAAAEPELDRLSFELHAAQRGSAGARSPWLAAPLQERLRRYDKQLDDVTVASDRALLAVQTLPGLLGDDRPTRWFVAVASPAESRDLGGAVNAYAVLIADQGRLRLERSGGVKDIGADELGRNLDGLDLPSRYLSQRPEVYWQNLTGYPDLPTTASAARVLWDQVVPGSPLDGVVYVDPQGLAALLRLTGPVTAPPLGVLDANNAAQLLLSDQYARFDVQEDRRDVLQEVARATFTALSTVPLPGPGAIGDALGPAVRGGHLAATSFSTEGQRLLDDVGAGGRLPAAAGGDLASLRTSNLLENKLDVHVRRSVRYQAVVDPATGRVEATATIELRSDASADLPDYVAANRRGLPKGNDLLEVAWYSGLGLQASEVDGRPVSATSDRERGWWTHSTKVEVPAGGSATVVFRLAGALGATHPYRLAVAPQAAAQDDAYAIEVEGVRGWIAGEVRQPKPAQRDDVVVRMRRR